MTKEIEERDSWRRVAEKLEREILRLNLDTTHDSMLDNLLFADEVSEPIDIIERRSRRAIAAYEEIQRLREIKYPASLCGAIVNAIREADSYKLLNNKGTMQIEITDMAAHINHTLLEALKEKDTELSGRCNELMNIADSCRVRENEPVNSMVSPIDERVIAIFQKQEQEIQRLREIIQRVEAAQAEIDRDAKAQPLCNSGRGTARGLEIASLLVDIALKGESDDSPSP